MLILCVWCGACVYVSMLASCGSLSLSLFYALGCYFSCVKLRDPRSGVTPKWDFGVAMLPVGALCFYQAHFGRTVLLKWPFWAHLFFSVFYSVSELRRACFRQARVARAVLPPGALFRAGAFALPPRAPKSHIRPLPHLGVSD